jgi:hypothetical protein
MTDLPYSTGVIRAGRKVDERVILPFHSGGNFNVALDIAQRKGRMDRDSGNW